MAISETFVDHPAPLPKPQPFALAKEPNEMPRSFVPARLPDLAPIQARREQMMRMIANLDHERDQYGAKIARAAKTLQDRDNRLEEIDETKAKITEAEALNIINASSSVDLDQLKEALSALQEQVSASERDCAAANRAIDIIREKVDEIESKKATIKLRLKSATRDWLIARRLHRYDAIRYHFHQLYDEMAALLAIENHSGFDHNDTPMGLRFIESFRSAVRFDSPIRPTWFNVVTSKEFPGFAEACQQLASEMAGDSL
ncbi:hypothetical protein LVY75_12390 [Sinorhizobium sp. B11]